MKDRKVSTGMSLSLESLEICGIVIEERKFKNISRFVDFLIKEYANKNSIKAVNASPIANTDKAEIV